MSASRYVVLGATGHVGSVVAARLLDKGKSVRAVARDVTRLAGLSQRGAEVVPGSVDDPEFLRRAFHGASAAFVMLPPFPGPGVRAWQDRTAGIIGDALEVEDVAHAVVLSSIGAELASGNGPVAGLHALEERLARIRGLAPLFLRPGYFFENNLFAIGAIRAMGGIVGALGPDVKMAHIASRDIGEVAAKRLLSPDWKGVVVQELHGERDLTMAEVTHALGTAIGRPDLKYTQAPYADARRGMVQGGIPAELADLYVEMSKGFNEGKVKPLQRRSRASTTPTPIERWASEIFRPVYEASAPRPGEEARGHA